MGGRVAADGCVYTTQLVLQIVFVFKLIVTTHGFGIALGGGDHIQLAVVVLYAVHVIYGVYSSSCEQLGNSILSLKPTSKMLAGVDTLSLKFYGRRPFNHFHSKKG